MLNAIRIIRGVRQAIYYGQCAALTGTKVLRLSKTAIFALTSSSLKIEENRILNCEIISLDSVDTLLAFKLLQNVLVSL